MTWRAISVSVGLYIMGVVEQPPGEPSTGGGGMVWVGPGSRLPDVACRVIQSI